MNGEGVLLLAAFGWICISIGGCAQHKSEQQKAIKAGVAYYATDQNGEPQFKYITE